MDQQQKVMNAQIALATKTNLKRGALGVGVAVATTPIFKVGSQQGFATGEMGLNDQFAPQKSRKMSAGL